ncbi:MAG TPA: GDP-mannose 4,6-dehydratase [archaeon]|nr:GDP-mannose 4,6-dehydratase [archaeon]
MPLEAVKKHMEGSDVKQKLASLYPKGIMVDENNWGDYLKKFSNITSVIPSKEFWSGRKVLVTGVGGFLGPNLAKMLIDFNANVNGVVLNRDMSKYPNVSDLRDSMKVYVCNLIDYSHVSEVIKEVKPEFIFHYAAMSFVPTSLVEPAAVLQNNIISTVNILHAVARHGKDNISKIFTALSSEQYGFVRSSDELPLKETSDQRPESAYAVSKIATEKVGESYYYNDLLPVLRIRSFNQEGVGDMKLWKRARDERFFTMTVAKQIAEFMKGKRNSIVIQNPNALRDFIDVNDSIAAHIIAAEKVEPNEPYNVCSSHGILTGDFAVIAGKLFGIPEDKILVNTDAIRSYEKHTTAIHGFIGDNSKLTERIGWRPTRTLENIIRNAVEFQMRKMG